MGVKKTLEKEIAEALNLLADAVIAQTKVMKSLHAAIQRRLPLWDDDFSDEEIDERKPN
ncbi:MAG: hypothetical protein JW793_08950 [Acidobacteria bacterium]|nr:hypothetical protein [Acidobacteriota bacterium]